MDGVKQVSDYIQSNPNRKVLADHGGGKYTFHNVKILEILIYWIQNKIKKTVKSLTKKNNDTSYKPFMARIMEQYNQRPKIMTRGVDPKAPPPKGYVLNWDREQGYHYTEAVGQRTTNNQALKKDQAIHKPKRKLWREYKDGHEK